MAHGGDHVEELVHTPTLWVGGAVTAVVAALTAVLGAYLAPWAFGAPVLTPPLPELLGETPIARLANLAAVVAMATTGLAYLLLLVTPQAVTLLSWIVGCASMVGAMWPYVTTAAPASQLATSLVNLCTGAAIGGLVTTVATHAVIRSGPPDITPRVTS